MNRDIDIMPIVQVESYYSIESWIIVFSVLSFFNNYHLFNILDLHYLSKIKK